MLAGKLLQVGGSRPLPEFVSSSTGVGTSPSVSVPSGVQDGDLLVAVSFMRSAADVTPPTGFSVIANGGTATVGYSVAVKTAASESGSYTFTFGVGSTVAVLAYRNATRVNTLGDVSYSSTTSATASTITPTYRGTLLAAFGLDTNPATITSAPSGMTERASRTTNAPSLYVYDKSPQEAASTGTASATWSTSLTDAAISFLLQITNEPDVEPDFVAMAQTQTPSTDTSLVINKPTGTQEGDLMIAVMATDQSPTWTGDTGWTEVCDQGSTPALRVAYKVAGGSEPASYTFTASASRRLSGAILTYRYAAYDTIAGSFTTAADPLVLTSISPTASQSILIAVGARNGVSVTLGTPTSMTARATDNDATSPSYIACDQSVAAGPTGTRSMSTGGTGGVAGIMLSIKPTRSL